MESRAKVEPGSGKHSVFTHYLKDPNCDLCLKTKITRASCRRRAGTVVPRAESFGDLITADHKILSEESESRNNHRYAVVVRDLATQWLQSYPCKTITFQETQKNLMECYCCLRNIQDLLSDGKTPCERRFGMPFNGPVIQFGAMVEFHPTSAKDISRLHQFGPKVLPGIFLGYVLYAGESGKETI